MKDHATEILDLLARIKLAKVPEVMLALEVLCSLSHGLNIEPALTIVAGVGHFAKWRVAVMRRRMIKFRYPYHISIVVLADYSHAEPICKRL